MKELVELIVKELVEDKDAVSIEESRDGGEVDILIHVAESVSYTHLTLPTSDLV